MVRPLRDHDPTDVGTWSLTGRLGEGGMGQVWLATDQRGQVAAVKTVNMDPLDEAARSRFQREAEAAAKIRSPWIANLLDVDLDHDPPFLVSEHVEGPTLAEYVAANGPLEPEQAVAFAAALADGIDSIHGAGVIHRDLSVRNIILSPSGPRIIDLGVADVEGATRITATGLAFGTPTAMAPEQLLGEPVGPPADVFAWAAAVTYAATGTLPFGSGTTEAITYRVVHQDPDLDSLPAALSPTVAAALEKDPATRPSPRQLAADLADADVDATQAIASMVQTSQLATRATDVPGPASATTAAISNSTPRRRGWLKVGGAAAVVVVTALAAGIFGIHDRLTLSPTVQGTSEESAGEEDEAADFAASDDDEAAREDVSDEDEDDIAADETESTELGSLPVRHQELEFQPDDGCQPHVGPEISGEWQTSAQIYPQPADQPVELYLRDKWNEHELADHEVTITVVPPDRSDAHDATSPLRDDGTATVYFPGDFPALDQASPGIHTAIWRVDGQLAACSGFELTDPDSTEAPPIHGDGMPLETDWMYLGAVGPEGSIEVAGGSDVCTARSEAEWQLDACEHVDGGAVAVWSASDVWNVVVYEQANGTARPVFDTGPLELGYVAGPPALHRASTNFGDAVGVEFPSGGTAAVTDLEVVAPGPDLAGGEATSLGGAEAHDEGFLLYYQDDVVADVRPTNAGWRVWRR